jgi:hypothetical protein
MPVRKYRSVADMPDATWRPALDPGNLPAALQVSALALRFAPAQLSPGVYRYRSVEDASEARVRWERTACPPQSGSRRESPGGGS